MSTIAKNPCVVVTGKVRLSYVQLLTPKAFNEGDQAKYSVTILIDKNTVDGKKTIADIQAGIKAAAEKGAQKHFGGRVPANPTNTLKDGDTEVDDMGELKCLKNPELVGHMYMRLANAKAPIVMDASRQPIMDENDIYSGCFGRVSLTTFAYSGDGRRGVSAVLNNVMKTEDGEPLVTILSGNEFGED